ncbi:laminin subunit gamma-2 [Bufo gargarizans]|uniref:laminin subunit gamma-2 n=1 Tax=Bufo gargarizans TaxID=30331 RepID=UPI001CF1932D|nr:laminin subunit gamma-2 [Bufo gargarizans]
MVLWRSLDSRLLLLLPFLGSLFVASSIDVHISVCNCNGHSQRCVFDPELQAQTGSGFRCIDCNGGTDGPNCERCKDGYYPQLDGACAACDCYAKGSLSSQCDNYGRCSCKPGVMGEKCDRCQPGFHSLTEAGCRRQGCQCDPAGSSQGCDSGGNCICKTQVIGESCDRCKPGYYNLQAGRSEGCLQCFCYGHSAICSSSDYSRSDITTSFEKGVEGWTAALKDGSPASVPVRMSRHHKEVYLASRQLEPLYFSAPGAFLGDQSRSYGQMFSISFRVDRGRHRAGAEDLILEGGGLRVTAPLTTSKTSLPCRIPQTYTFRLDELSFSPWTPKISHYDFRRLLSNVTSLKIRATYGEYSTGYLQSITLVSARLGPGDSAPWVEKCDCPAGYIGDSCEQCAQGYYRESPALGAFSPCVPCRCQGGGRCDPETGDCYSGDENQNIDCADCPHGQYNDPRDPQRCLPCPCRPGIGCLLSPETQEPTCDHCPVGLSGPRCEMCADGYFGDPEGERGPRRQCRPCACNNNIDPNAAGNCDRVTGECLKCIHNTAGLHCDRCREGYFGDPLDPNPEGKCKACSCHPIGSQQPSCQKGSTCVCKPDFYGDNCDQPQCPSCYSQVSNKMTLYRRQLQGLIGGANGQSQATDTRYLEEQMRRAEEASTAMLRDSESTHGAELSLQRQMSGLQGIQAETQNDLERVQMKLQGAQSQSSQYQSQLQDLKGKITIAIQQLNSGQAELNQLTFSSLESSGNSNSFSQIGQEAQTIANRLSQDAQMITQDAADALADTQRAMQILRSGDVDLGAAERLRARLGDIRTQTGTIESEAIQAAAAAERSYHESMQTAREVAQASRLDPLGIQGEMERLRGESLSLRTSVEGEISQIKTLQSKVTVTEQEVEQQLREGQEKQLIADQLLSRANAAKNKAEKAMQTGNSTYYAIEEMLGSLRGFGDTVGDRRTEAEDALRRLPEIMRMTQGAVDTTAKAEAGLKGAEKDSGTAIGNAREAQSITTAIQQDMMQMGLDANSTAEMALTLEREFAQLRKMFSGTAGNLDDRTRISDEDSAAAQSIAASALEAEASAVGTFGAVTETLNALDHVLGLLDQPIEGSEEGIRALELSLRSARTKVAGELRPALEVLELAAKNQKQEILFLETEILQTVIDIQNLRDIRKALPPGCYSTSAIERP